MLSENLSNEDNGVWNKKKRRKIEKIQNRMREWAREGDKNKSMTFNHKIERLQRLDWD